MDKLLSTSLSLLSTSTDNAVRARVEEDLEKMWTQQPSEMFNHLTIIIANESNPLHIRGLAAVMARRAVGRPFGDKVVLFDSVPLNQKKLIQDTLISIMASQSIPTDLSNKIADYAAEIARNRSDNWPIEFIGQSLTSDPERSSQQIMSSLRILQGAPNILSTPQHHQSMATVLTELIKRRGSMIEQVVSALISIVIDEPKAYVPVIQSIATNVHTLIATGDDDCIESWLEGMISMIEECPKLFKDVTADFTLIGLQLASSNENEDDNFGRRSLAIEMVMCLVEEHSRVFKRRRELAIQTANVIVQMIAQVEDCPEWYAVSDPDEDDGIDEVGILGEQCLDRFAIALGGQTVAEPLFQLFQGMLQSNDWRHWYGALKGIASCAEGCMDVIEDRLDDILALIWPAFSHPHPRVQYAACHALGQLCTDYQGAIQQNAGLKALRQLLTTLSNSQTARVQQHAAAAMVNFAEGVESDLLKPILADLLTVLVSVLTNCAKSSNSLQQQLIATIAAFSTPAGQSFQSFLPGLLPILMPLLTTNNGNNDPNYRMLQCRAVEAISLFALAVGKEVFFVQNRNFDFMQSLKNFESFEMQSDDPMVEYLASSWVRMCQVLKADFAPYLPICLPKLVKQAHSEADVTVLDVLEDKNEENDDGWDFAEINGRRYGINTALLEEKCGALENLSVIADAMESAFSPFSHEILFNLAIPLLSFSLHDGVEAASADLCSSCVRSMAMADMSVAKNWTAQVIPQLLETAQSMYSPDYSTAAIDAISSLLAWNDGALLPLASGHVLIQSISETTTSIIRLAAKRAVGNAQDEEDEEAGEEKSDDGEVVYSVARLFATMVKVYKSSFYPLANSGILKFAMEQASPAAINRKPPATVHAAICMIVDALQWMGAELYADHTNAISACLMIGMKHGDRDVRQAAVYGVGVAAKIFGFEQFCLNSALPILLQHLSNPNAKAPSNANLTDNVTSALIKIVSAFPATFSQEASFKNIMQAILQGFPVITDESEFGVCYAFLAECLSGPLASIALSCNPLSVFDSLISGSIGHPSRFIDEILRAKLLELIPAVKAAIPVEAASTILHKYDPERLKSINL